MEKAEYENIFNLEAKHWWYIGMRNIAFSLLDKYVKKTAKVLDAGCGTGLNLIYLKKYGKTFGVDYSTDAIKFSKKRKCDVRKASVEKLPFRKNSFDLVTCFDVLYHKGVKSDLKALKEFNRVSKKGAYLFIRVPAFPILRGCHDEVVHTRERYTKKQLENKLKQAGFKIEKISYANMFLFLFVFLTRKIKSGTDITPTSKLTNKALISLLKIESFLLKITNLPFGVSLICIAKKLN